MCAMGMRIGFDSRGSKRLYPYLVKKRLGWAGVDSSTKRYNAVYTWIYKHISYQGSFGRSSRKRKLTFDIDILTFADGLIELVLDGLAGGAISLTHSTLVFCGGWSQDPVTTHMLDKWINNPAFYNECYYLSMLRLKLIHVSKRPPWTVVSMKTALVIPCP